MSRFDKPTDRSRTSGTFSIKWNISDGELPMWVADMDFRTAPEIITALQKRLDNDVFGYTDVPAEWDNAVARWWRRHNFAVQADSLLFVTGIVPAISSMVRKLTTPAEKVLVQPPVYNFFYNSIVNNGRTPSECPLEYDEACAAGTRGALIPVMMLFARGLIIALAFGVTVGAVGVLCLQRMLSRGFLAGFVTGLRSTAADVLYATADVRRLARVALPRPLRLCHSVHGERAHFCL